MATSNLDFAAQIEAWAMKTKERAEAIFHESTQRVVSEAQSRIPVQTGFARASIRASTSSMPPIDPNAKGQKGASYPYESAQITVTLVGAELGQTIYVGWTANYVQLLEYGHSKQAPSGFVGLAAAKWPSIVDQVTQELKARAGH